MRILSIDYGLRRIGLAVTSTAVSMALPLETIEHYGCPKKAALRLKKRIDELKDIVEIVIGWPLLLNGKISPLCCEIEKVINELKQHTLIPIVLVDERLTTKILQNSYKSCNFSRKESKSFLDQGAAVMILDTHLERKKFSNLT